MSAVAERHDAHLNRRSVRSISCVMGTRTLDQLEAHRLREAARRAADPQRHLDTVHAHRERKTQTDPGLLRPRALKEYRRWLAEHGEKFCPKCGLSKVVALFYRDGTTSDNLGSWCIACNTANSRRYVAERQDDPLWRARKHAIERRSWLMKKYGMTVDQYDALWASQGNGCAICGSAEAARYALDHDHKTGAVRGILCDGHNTGLGRFNDDPDLLEAAAAYLRRCLPRG